MPFKKLWILVVFVALGATVAIGWAANESGGSTPAAVETLRARHHTFRKIAESSDKRIDECSGLAASRRYPGYLWVHNDSGDTARLFLISTSGETVATVNLENANAFDWEDMAISGDGENAEIYVGDIGDNFRWRSNITVFRLREPKVDIAKTNQVVNVRAERMTLEYTGRRADAETLIATPGGRLLIVTKLADGSSIWQTPQPFADGARQTLQRIGKYSFAGDKNSARLATGGDLSPDGRRIAIITYAALYEWDVPFKADGAADWSKVWEGAPQISPLPPGQQNEAVCYSADGEKLFVADEGTPMPLYVMEAEK